MPNEPLRTHTIFPKATEPAQMTRLYHTPHQSVLTNNLSGTLAVIVAVAFLLMIWWFSCTIQQKVLDICGLSLTKDVDEQILMHSARVAVQDLLAQQADNQIQSLNAELELCRSRLDAAEQLTAPHLEEVIVGLKVKIEELSSESTIQLLDEINLTNKVEYLEKDLKDEKTNAEDLNRRLKTAQANNSHSYQTIEKVSKQLEESRTLVRDLQSSNERNGKTLRQTAQELDHANELYFEMRDRHSLEYKELQDKFWDLERSSIAAEAAAQKDKKIANQQHHSFFENLRTNHERLKSDYDRVKADLEKLKADHKNLKLAREKGEDDLKDLRLELKVVEAKLSSNTREFDEFRAAPLCHDLAKINLSSTTTETPQLQQVSAASNSETDALRTELAAEKEELKSERAAFKLYKKETEESEVQQHDFVSDLENKITDLETKLDQVQQSAQHQATASNSEVTKNVDAVLVAKLQNTEQRLSEMNADMTELKEAHNLQSNKFQACMEDLSRTQEELEKEKKTCKHVKERLIAEGKEASERVQNAETIAARLQDDLKGAIQTSKDTEKRLTAKDKEYSKRVQYAESIAVELGKLKDENDHFRDALQQQHGAQENDGRDLWPEKKAVMEAELSKRQAETSELSRQLVEAQEITKNQRVAGSNLLQSNIELRTSLEQAKAQAQDRVRELAERAAKKQEDALQKLREEAQSAHDVAMGQVTAQFEQRLNTAKDEARNNEEHLVREVKRQAHDEMAQTKLKWKEDAQKALKMREQVIGERERDRDEAHAACEAQRQSIEEKDQEIHERKCRMEVLAYRVKDLEAECACLSQQDKAYELTAENLNEQVQVSQDDMRTLHTDIEDLSVQVSKLSTELEDRNATIVELEKRFAERLSEVSSADTDVVLKEEYQTLSARHLNLLNKRSSTFDEQGQTRLKLEDELQKAREATQEEKAKAESEAHKLREVIRELKMEAHEYVSENYKLKKAAGIPDELSSSDEDDGHSDAEAEACSESEGDGPSDFEMLNRMVDDNVWPEEVMQSFPRGNTAEAAIPPPVTTSPDTMVGQAPFGSPNAALNGSFGDSRSSAFDPTMGSMLSSTLGGVSNTVSGEASFDPALCDFSNLSTEHMTFDPTMGGMLDPALRENSNLPAGGTSFDPMQTWEPATPANLDSSLDPSMNVDPSTSSDPSVDPSNNPTMNSDQPPAEDHTMNLDQTQPTNPSPSPPWDPDFDPLFNDNISEGGNVDPTAFDEAYSEIDPDTTATMPAQTSTEATNADEEMLAQEQEPLSTDNIMTDDELFGQERERYNKIPNFDFGGHAFGSTS